MLAIRFLAFFEATARGEEFWKGAYAYHFHNQYQRKSWPANSWAGKLLEIFKLQISNATTDHEIIGLKPEHADLLDENQPL